MWMRDQEVFLIMSFHDYELGQAPILMEYQTWNLNDKRFEGVLRPEVRDTQFVGKRHHARANSWTCVLLQAVPSADQWISSSS